MKRLNLVFVLCLLFVGKPLYGQWYFNYMCGLSNLQKQGGYPTKSACEAAARAAFPCNGVTVGDDISTLVEADDASAELIASSWGFGGFALESNIRDASSHLYLWSSSIDANGGALYLWNGYGAASYDYDNQDALPGFQVRCVK
jgi:hypothetical protein